MAKMTAIKGWEKGAIDLIEEAFHLLRTTPVTVLLSYYIGSMPFVLMLLYFWADMSRGTLGREYLTEAALGLTFLYIWMKCWQSVFANQLLAIVSRRDLRRYSGKSVLRLILTQTIFQPYQFVVLIFSALIVLPFGWMYAFYQNLSVTGNGATLDIKKIREKTWHFASLWPAQNHRILLILSLFGSVVFLNLAVVLLMLPHLLKTLFGIETIFTLSGMYVLNTTFLSAVCACCYLVMNPLIKTIYTLRCFYGEALHTGADLIAELEMLEANS